jgi:N-acetylneuraminic acid mutarotase
VTTQQGVICIGGHDGTAPQSAVFLLRWNQAQGDVAHQDWPSLPEPLTNTAAAVASGWLYVAGGEGRAGAANALLRLRLEGAERSHWEPLPGWPGPQRFGGVLIPVTAGGGPRLLFAGGLPGPARSQDDYLRDVMLFDPERGRWEKRAMMPRGAVLGTGISVAEGRSALVLGGSDGHDFARMKALGDRYRIPDDVMEYDVEGDAWRAAGTMPLGVVGAAVVSSGVGSWVVAGGEPSPGRRTPQVHELRVTRP